MSRAVIGACVVGIGAALYYWKKLEDEQQEIKEIRVVDSPPSLPVGELPNKNLDRHEALQDGNQTRIKPQQQVEQEVVPEESGMPIMSFPEPITPLRPNAHHSKPVFVLPLAVKGTKDHQALSLERLKSKKNLDDVDWEGKRVLCRVDYNVPVVNGVVTDEQLIRDTIDTLTSILSRREKAGGCKCLILIAHRGRPRGADDRSDLSLKPCLPVLERLLHGYTVRFLPECIGPMVEREIEDCEPGTVFLLENLRFHIEEYNDPSEQDNNGVRIGEEAIEKFAENLSRLGDLFVLEAFPAAFRKHTSIVNIRCPDKVAGLTLQKETLFYADLLGNPSRPFLAILGGQKVTEKGPVIMNLINIVDEIFIGGGLAYTFKKIRDGMDIGRSIYDKQGEAEVARILKKAQEKGVKLHFPVDHVIGDRRAERCAVGVTDDETGVLKGWMAFDLGPKTRSELSKIIARARAIVWAGALGVTEIGTFQTGTLSVMADLVEATKHGAKTVVAGGDTARLCSKFYFGRESAAKQLTHISTGGSSSLVLLAGKMLAGVAALDDVEPVHTPHSASSAVDPTNLNLSAQSQ